MEKDLVSIIMPSYNTANFIEESIESVINQSYQKWELIIIDDCSEDDTEFIVQKISDRRILFNKNECNYGAAFSRNLAIKKARGEWIAFLDSDDIWLPTKLEKQLEFMKNKKVYFSYTQYQIIDEDSNLKKILISGPKRINKAMMYTYCWPGCLTVMYNAQKVGVVQIENLKKNNDYAIWLRVIDRCDCYLFQKDLARYRKRDGSISNANYVELLKYHYLLFKKGEKMPKWKSLFLTFLNLTGGLYKKIYYTKRKI